MMTNCCSASEVPVVHSQNELLIELLVQIELHNLFAFLKTVFLLNNFALFFICTFILLKFKNIKIFVVVNLTV